MLSGSMAPSILPGDLLQVIPIDGARARIGDIVVFRGKGMLIAHRLILAFRLGGFSLLVERGDASVSASVIRSRNIVGRVESVIREGRSISLRTPETIERGRRISTRAFIRFLAFEALIGNIKRIIGHHV
jgi:signal peptidase I